MRKILLVSAIVLSLAHLGTLALGKDKKFCDDTLVPNKDIADGSLKYSTRDENRCEGYYLKPHSQPPIALVSLMGKNVSEIPKDGEQMHLLWVDPGSEQTSDTFVQVNSIVNGCYYRMDTMVERNQNFFDWPLEVLTNNGQQASDISLGYRAWFLTDEDPAERVFLPVTNAPFFQGQTAQDSLFYPITGHVFCRLEIDALSVQISEKSEKGQTLIDEQIIAFSDQNTYQKAITFLLEPKDYDLSGRKLLRIAVQIEPDKKFIHSQTYHVHFPEKEK